MRTIIFIVLVLNAGTAVVVAQENDPFKDIPVPPPAPQTAGNPSWLSRFVNDNFGFRKEIMSEFDTDESANGASRQSVGFEVLKKFSSETSTIASFDFQARLVRRDGFNPVLNDMEGAARQGWAFEYHNLYVDFYNIFNSLLTDDQRSKNVGRFNFRAGHFYVPFGLNLQTDTHGTILQLSNEQNFGFERDWYTGFWGRFNKHLNYDAYYMAGSGYDLKFKGQSGLGAFRLSLANKYSSEYGLEAGLSILGGERLSSDMNMTQRPIATQRIGIDGRYRHSVRSGLVTFSSELSGGHDAHVPVISQLYQTDYLRSSRRWGLAAQYRRLEQQGVGADAYIIGEFTWYFRNDVGNSNLHWIKINIQHTVESTKPQPATIVSLQYYFYR